MLTVPGAVYIVTSGADRRIVGHVAELKGTERRKIAIRRINRILGVTGAREPRLPYYGSQTVVSPVVVIVAAVVLRRRLSSLPVVVGMAQSSSSVPTSAVRALQLELKKLHNEPVEGFKVRLVDDDNIFEWEVAIFGPPGTLYEGGYFKVQGKRMSNQNTIRCCAIHYTSIGAFCRGALPFRDQSHDFIFARLIAETSNLLSL